GPRRAWCRGRSASSRTRSAPRTGAGRSGWTGRGASARTRAGRYAAGRRSSWSLLKARGVGGSVADGVLVPAAGLLGALEDVVDEAVLLGVLGAEPPVAVGVLVDLLDGLAGVLGDELGHLRLDEEHLLGLDLDVRGRTADAAGGLVHHHAGVRGRVALALRARGQEELAHGRGQTHRDRRDVVGDPLHRVVDGHARGD